MATRADFEKRVTTVLGGVTPPGHLSEYIEIALREHEKFRPRILVQDITGDGTDEYDLAATFVYGASTVLSITRRDDSDFDEIPISVHEDEWEIERKDDDSLQIRFLTFTPNSSDKVVIEYTGQHTLDTTTSTIEVRDEAAFDGLVLHYALSAAANAALSRRVQSTDAFSDPRIEEARALREQAKHHRNRYDQHMGLAGAGGAGTAAPVKAAMGFVDIDPGDPKVAYGLGTNRYRHTHRRRRY